MEIDQIEGTKGTNENPFEIIVAVMKFIIGLGSSIQFTQNHFLSLLTIIALEPAPHKRVAVKFYSISVIIKGV